jgi:nucleotide-binding universal stress UspA family protein
MTDAAETIICGVDDSEAARGAVSVAASLAAVLGRRLVLLHVAEQRARARVATTSPHVSPGASEAGASREAPEHLLDRLAHELGLSTSTGRRVEVGDLARVLPRVESPLRRRPPWSWSARAVAAP